MASASGPAGASTCGNGVVDFPEPCDDGNLTSGDGCSFPSCLPEVCGDDILNPDVGETCDDGGTAPNDGCDANCHLECGNGTVEGAETCDGGGESSTCDDDCTAVQCGDGNVNEAAGEDCEPPGTPTCDTSCGVDCSPFTLPELRCVTGVNAGMRGVLVARSRDDAACLRRAARGVEPFASCFGLDRSGGVARARSRTLTAEARHCTGNGVPTAVYTSGEEANAAGEGAAAAAFSAAFGASPALALRDADPAGARCQAEVARRVARLASVVAADLDRGIALGLRGGPGTPPACTSKQLADVADAFLDASRRVARARSALVAGVAARCAGAAIGALFDCGGAGDLQGLAACAQALGFAAGCEAVAAADELVLDCH